MPDYQGEKFKEFLDRQKISVVSAAQQLGVNRQTVYKYFRSKNLSREVVDKIIQTFGTTEHEVFRWIKLPRLEVKPRLEAKPLQLASDPNDYDNDGSKFEDLGNGMLRMRVRVVPQKAWANYPRGYQDPEFYEDFQTVSFDVHKEYRGHYLAFEVKGDSMITTDPELFDQMALPGWKAVARELPRHHWKYKLHIHKTDTWIIVHRTDGILIKNIIAHDVENAKITVHSLNPKYPDDVIDLNDVSQIFNVVKYIIDK